MDSMDLSKVDQLRGFQALRENRFFQCLVEAIAIDGQGKQNVVDGPVLADGIYEYFRAKGYVEATARMTDFLDKTIIGLEHEVKEENEARQKEQEGQNNVSE